MGDPLWLNQHLGIPAVHAPQLRVRSHFQPQGLRSKVAACVPALVTVSTTRVKGRWALREHARAQLAPQPAPSGP